jgi:hypothetical protein
MYIVATLFIVFDILAYIHLQRKYNLKPYDIIGVFNSWSKEFGGMKKNN